MRRNRILMLGSAALVLAIGLAGLVRPSSADSYYRRGTFVLGGGFNNPVGEIDQYLNSSGTLLIAGGRHLNERNTIQIEYTHNWLGIDDNVLDAAESDSIQFDNAYASCWSLTLNMINRFHPESDTVPWITAGIGYYKRNVLLTENTAVYYPPIYDPYWGWIGGGWAPGETINGQNESLAFGFNVGGGVDFSIESGASLFLDVRYHYAFTEGVPTTYIPITAGIRW